MTVVRFHHHRKPTVHEDQSQVPVGRRVNDLLTLASEIAGLTDYRYPVALNGEDRLYAAMLLPDHPDPAGVLLGMIGELHTAQAHDASDDHNEGDPVEAEKHRGAAADMARDALLADQTAAGR